MRVAGLDPGNTSGFVLYDATQAVVVRHFEAVSPLNIAATLRSLQIDSLLDHVVVEDFIGQGPRDPHVIHTLKVLGFLQYFCEYFGIPVTIQVPQTRKAFLSDAGRIIGPGHHFTDALAHVLAYIHYNHPTLSAFAPKANSNSKGERREALRRLQEKAS